jgi:hypothetical protein
LNAPQPFANSEIAVEIRIFNSGDAITRFSQLCAFYSPKIGISSDIEIFQQLRMGKLMRAEISR